MEKKIEGCREKVSGINEALGRALQLSSSIVGASFPIEEAEEREDGGTLLASLERDLDEAQRKADCLVHRLDLIIEHL